MALRSTDGSAPRTTAITAQEGIADRQTPDQSGFQPAAFVSSLQGIGLPKTRFDGRAAKFCRDIIFEFCNTIHPIPAAPSRALRGRFGP